MDKIKIEVVLGKGTEEAIVSIAKTLDRLADLAIKSAEISMAAQARRDEMEAQHENAEKERADAREKRDQADHAARMERETATETRRIEMDTLRAQSERDENRRRDEEHSIRMAQLKKDLAE